MVSDGEFSFASQAPDFDRHITASIRGYDGLRDDCVALSQYFIQPKTKVLDIGCSEGTLLRRVREHNLTRFQSVKYVGIDVEYNFRQHWGSDKSSNVIFKKKDITKYTDFDNTSLVISLYTFQFLPETERLPLMKRIYDGLVDGGAVLIAEKVHAKNAKFQDMLAFTYYDYKRQSFTEKQILDKERSIRNQMKPWSEWKLFEMIRAAGFVSTNTQLFWRNHLFVGILAYKPAKFRGG